mmetsp:Transcript_85405/g.167112  ORF Transcript_85405/g.167112 Transcript_85405/m.167112 type:complete len:233 (-) Transcript_85405:155-853(-)
MREHGLVRVLVDSRFPDRRAGAFRGQLSYDFRLLVAPDVLLQSGAHLQLLAGPPQVRLRPVQHSLQVRHAVELLPVFQLHPSGVVGWQSVEGRVGDHDRAPHVVDVHLACVLVKRPPLGDQVDRDCRLGLLCGAPEHICDLGGRGAARPVAMLVGVGRLPVRVDVELGHVAQGIGNAPRLLGSDRAVAGELLHGDRDAQHLEPQIVQFAKVPEQVFDFGLHGGLVQKLVLLF